MLLLAEPIETKQARAKLELKRRWKGLTGEQLTKAINAYFREFHNARTKTKEEETADILKVFDGGLGL